MFEVGDRIIYIMNPPSYGLPERGAIATVKEIVDNKYAVEFDKRFSEGHRCGTLGLAENRGRWISEHLLRGEAAHPSEYIKLPFEVGDRLLVSQSNQVGVDKGSLATVVNFDHCALTCAVEFDEPFELGHDCHGATKDKQGRYVYIEPRVSTLQLNHSGCFKKIFIPLLEPEELYYLNTELGYYISRLGGMTFEPDELKDMREVLDRLHVAIGDKSE